MHSCVKRIEKRSDARLQTKTQTQIDAVANKRKKSKEYSLTEVKSYLIQSLFNFVIVKMYSKKPHKSKHKREKVKVFRLWR